MNLEVVKTVKAVGKDLGLEVTADPWQDCTIYRFRDIKTRQWHLSVVTSKEAALAYLAGYRTAMEGQSKNTET